MDCREARILLAAYHDGELVPGDRTRVEGHLLGCGECAALLARLAGVDANVDVPDPGPEYWERFNRRVMDRVRNEDAAPAKVVRPKRGWGRRQLPYFLPAVAAAALFLVVVRQTGLDPFSTAVPPSPPARQEAPAVPPTSAPPATPSAVPPAVPPAARAPEVGRNAALPAAPPPSVTRERPASESTAEPFRKRGAPEREAPSAGFGPVPEAAPASPAEPMRTLPSPPARDESVRREWAADKEMTPGKTEEGKAKPMMSASSIAAPSPCDAARSLAGRERLEEAEAAQRSCLAQRNAPALQESGLVFLAELLDRQARFAEADAVIRETQRQFPGSRPLDAYLAQRSQVQNRALPAVR